MDDTAFTAPSFNALLYLFLFLSFFTGLLHAQSGGGAARLKLNRNVTASSNTPSNMQQTFTWPNKSKCLVVLHFILSYFPEPVCSIPTTHSPRFECRRRQQVFFSPKSPDPFWGPPTPYSTCLGVIFRGFLRPVRETDHSLPSRVKVKNEWSYTSTPSICLQGVDTESFTCGCAVSWGTALQGGRSRVRFLMVALKFFIDIILPAALWP